MILTWSTYNQVLAYNLKYISFKKYTCLLILSEQDLRW